MDATGVVVDVVVRDKRGQPVTDLTAADFELLEDGVPQRIASMELQGTARSPAAGSAIPPQAAAKPAEPGTPAALSPEPPRFTALVFDRLEPDSINMARSGAEAAVANTGGSDLLAVFVIDGSLRMLQNFTNDRQQLSAAAGRAIQHAAQLITRDAGGTRHDGGGTPATVAGADSADASPPSLSAPPGAPPAFTGALRRASDMLERQFSAHSSLDALLTATAGLGALPGRKTLLYFSDSVPLPDTAMAALDDVVAAANRGQVTIYAVDTGGLRIGSSEAVTARDVKRIANAGLTINQDGSSGTSLALLEQNEDALRKAPRVGLTLLSRPTGGFLVENTNDLAAGIRLIEADRRIYYLLTYAPARPELDGRFRSIVVKVKRRDVTVQARGGYVAVRAPDGLPVLVYEGPALAALGRTPAPRDVPVAVAAFALPRAVPDARGVRDDLAVVVGAPAAPLTFAPKGGRYQTDFAMLALVRDADGRTAHKTSLPIRATGPLSQRDAAQAGEVRFVRTLPTPPGTYTTAGAVHDQPSGRAGTAVGPPVAIAARGATGLGVSSVIILKRLERTTTEIRARGDRLVIGEYALTPYLPPVDGMHRAAGAKLAFFLTAVGAAPGERLSGRVQVKATDGEGALIDAAIPFDPADANGQVVCVGQLPIERLPEGPLQLVVTIERHGDSDVRRAAFHLLPAITAP